jgi:6-phosphofructokinase 2
MPDVVTLTVNPAIDISTSVPRVAATRKLRCTAARRDPGGGGINVARVVKRLGGSVAAIYPAGGDTGLQLRHLLDAEEIESLPIAIAEETRIGFTVSEEDTGKQFRFVLPGPSLAEDKWRACLDALAAAARGPRFIVASGSLPPGVPKNFYAQAARIAKDCGAKFVLDTSGDALDAALREGVYLVKPNLRELRELTGTALADDPALVAAARSLVRTHRAEVVALTLGQRGALLTTPTHTLRAEGPPVQVVSAVGAGDSFLGGMVFQLAAGKSVEDAFRFGVAAGAAAVLSPGTDLGHPKDIERFYPNVAIQEVRPAAA